LSDRWLDGCAKSCLRHQQAVSRRLYLLNILTSTSSCARSGS